MDGEQDNRRSPVKPETVADVIARTIGYRQPTDGLLGSGLEQIIAYSRAADIAKALGIPPTLPAEKLRRWASGEVTHIGGGFDV